jgi:hypothetical protein
MPTVYKWKIYCTTENAFIEGWSETAITTCPNNTAHTVNPDSVSEVEVISPSNVNLIQGAPPIGSISTTPVGGFYRQFTRAFDCPVSATTTDTFSFPFPVAILGACLPVSSDMKGDIINAYAANNVTVGVLTAPVALLDTVIPVSLTVIQNIFPGRKVSITDGVNTTDYIQVISKNTDTNTITLQTGSTFAFAAGSVVRLRIHYIDTMELSEPGTVKIGVGSINGTYIPTNIAITISYQNTSAVVVKRPSFFIEILY